MSEGEREKDPRTLRDSQSMQAARNEMKSRDGNSKERCTHQCQCGVPRVAWPRVVLVARTGAGIQNHYETSSRWSPCRPLIRLSALTWAQTSDGNTPPEGQAAIRTAWVTKDHMHLGSLCLPILDPCFSRSQSAPHILLWPATRTHLTERKHTAKV